MPLVKTNPFNVKTRFGLWFLMGVIVTCFFAEGFDPKYAIDLFGLWPAANPHGNPIYQVVTYALLHGNFAHIGIDIFMLWMFGRGIEAVWGARGLILLFLTGSIAAGCFHLLFVAVGWSPTEPTIGASGGTAALLGAFAWLFPRAGVMLLFPPIPMRAWMGLTVVFVAEFVFFVTGAWPGISHGLHVAAFVFGMLVAATVTRLNARRETDLEVAP